MSLLLKKLFVMTAVPAAVALSYSPAQHTASAAHVEMQTGTLATQPASAVSARHKPAMTADALRQELERQGLPPERAQRAVSSASCAGGLASTAHAWLRGERFTGIMLVSDNAQGLCGYGDVPQWVFRTRMMSVGENIACATRLHDSALGPAWFAALDQLLASAAAATPIASNTAGQVIQSGSCATALAQSALGPSSSL